MDMKFQNHVKKYISDLATGEIIQHITLMVFPRYAKLECKTVKRKLKVFKL